jgi:hypothetical protein
MGTPPASTTPAVQYATPPAVLGEELDANHKDDVPLHFRMLENILGPASPPGYAVCDLGDGRLLAVTAEEPASVGQAKQDPRWCHAMVEELQAIEENHTWALADLPPGRRAI